MDSTQGSHFLRDLCPACFSRPGKPHPGCHPRCRRRLRHEALPLPEHVLVLWAAKKIGRPVKWVTDRSEAFVTDTQGRDNVTKLDLALDSSAAFSRCRSMTANIGAYLSNFAPEIPTASGAVMSGGVYSFPAIHVGSRASTRTRAGRRLSRRRPARGGLCGRAADRLRGAPPRDRGRRIAPRNFVSPMRCLQDALGLAYDSGDFARNLDDALAAADARFRWAAGNALSRGRFAGSDTRSISSIRVPAGRIRELRFDPSGTLTS